MPELDEKLLSLIGDEQRARQLLDLAQALKGGEQSKAGEPPAADSPAQADMASQAISAAQMISAMLAAPQTGEPAAPGPEPAREDASEQSSQNGRQAPSGMSFAAFAEVLPQLLQAFSGDSSTLADEKINLVKAIKPYAPSHEGSIDRAIKMASVAKAAKNALGVFGRQA